jgi:hypothetical protein
MQKIKERIGILFDEEQSSWAETDNPVIALMRMKIANLFLGNDGVLKEIDIIDQEEDGN